MTAALLIDDDTGLLESIRNTTAHLEVVTADNWEEGLAMFHVLSPDLVIADYNLPGSRHGLQLLAQIRKLRPSVRLVLISGYINEGDIDRIERLGLVDRALTKGSAVETAREIIGEIEAASQRAEEPTDWPAYATAYLSAAQISTESLDELDDLLIGNLPETAS